MKKTTLFIILILLISINIVNSQTAVQPIGAGTTNNPYQIQTLENLYWLSQADTAWDKNFIQTANINASSTVNWDSNKGFSEIGDGTTTFSGTYNGKGHIIDSLYIHRVGQNIASLFGYINNATIDSLGVVNVDITAKSRTASLVGMSENSQVNSCFGTGILNCSMYSGGLVGYNLNSTITNCFSQVSVSATDGAIGGLTGINRGGSISNCYSTELVTSNTTIDVGGLIGRQDNGGVTHNSFWNKEVSQIDTSASGTGLITAEMKDLCIYLDSTWDFLVENVNGVNDIWGLNNNQNNAYPFLSWQAYQETESCCSYFDITPPSLSCVGNQTVSSDSNNTYTIIGNIFDPTTVNDNCNLISVTNNINGGISLDGEILSNGLTTITWTATDSLGNISECSFDINVVPNTNICEINKVNKIFIYPNPAKNQITISSENIKINTLKIIDITGKTIIKPSLREANVTWQSVNIENLQNGIYFLKINNTETIKFIKE